MIKTNPLKQCEWDLFTSQRLRCEGDCETCELKSPCETLYSKVDSLRPDKTSAKYVTAKEWQVLLRYMDGCSEKDCSKCEDKATCFLLYERIERLCKRFYKELNRIDTFDRGNPCVTSCDIAINLPPLSFLDIKGFSAVGTGDWR